MLAKVAVGSGVDVGKGVAVGSGVDVGKGVAVGVDVAPVGATVSTMMIGAVAVGSAPQWALALPLVERPD
jgi:UDP-3-O-[3-hydroxymyristoyl] glucosamine N-acyltransferase